MRRDEDTARALQLLSAPEIDEDLVGVARLLGPAGVAELRRVALGRRRGLSAKQRAHAVEILARLEEIEESDLCDLAVDAAPSVRRHALSALRQQGRTQAVLGLIGRREHGATDQALVLRALRSLGDERHVAETLEWARSQKDVDLRNLAASALRAMRRRPAARSEPDELDRLAEDLDSSRQAPSR